MKKSFTLIELLAVILIIAILMGLVVSLIPQMRERARRTQCANNLRNIGLAIESYAKDNGSYNCLCQVLSDGSANSGAVAASLLPYIDTATSGGVKNNVWQCPSGRLNNKNKENGVSGEFASYLYNRGVEITNKKAVKELPPNLVTEFTPLIADRARNHKKPTGFGNILFGDGRVTGFSDQNGQSWYTKKLTFFRDPSLSYEIQDPKWGWNDYMVK